MWVALSAGLNAGTSAPAAASFTTRTLSGAAVPKPILKPITLDGSVAQAGANDLADALAALPIRRRRPRPAAGSALQEGCRFDPCAAHQ
jgi:hypothetical protein